MTIHFRTFVLGSPVRRQSCSSPTLKARPSSLPSFAKAGASANRLRKVLPSLQQKNHTSLVVELLQPSSWYSRPLGDSKTATMSSKRKAPAAASAEGEGPDAKRRKLPVSTNDCCKKSAVVAPLAQGCGVEGLVKFSPQLHFR